VFRKLQGSTVTMDGIRPNRKRGSTQEWSRRGPTCEQTVRSVTPAMTSIARTLSDVSLLDHRRAAGVGALTKEPDWSRVIMGLR
jgi:hypothetical protein